MESDILYAPAEGFSPPPQRSGKLLMFLLFILGLFNAIRCQANIWIGIAVLIVMSYLFPCPFSLRSPSLVLVLILCAASLTGAVVPRPVGPLVRGPVLLVTILQSVITPLLGLGSFFLTKSMAGESFAFGTLFCCCMPASSLFSEYITREATGRTFLCRYTVFFTAPASAVSAPLMVWLLSQLHGVPDNLIVLRWTSLVVLPIACLCAFTIGLVVQVLVARHSVRQRPEYDVALQYHSTFSDGRLSEMLEIGQQKWRSRITTLKAVLAALVHYAMLSAFFLSLRQTEKGSAEGTANLSRITSSSKGNSPLNLTTIFNVFFVQLSVMIIVALLSWYGSWKFSDAPEDRIAVLFLSTMKSEVFLCPIAFCLLSPKKGLGCAGSNSFLLAVGLYSCTQTLMSLLVAPLRRWRSHSNCRPGTTLLPQRFEKYPRSDYRP